MAYLHGAHEVQPVDERVARAAGAQHGLVIRSQAERLGATRRMIDHRIETGRWEKVAADVFRIAGSPRSWRQRVLAAAFAWGPGSAISHRAAAPLLTLAGFGLGRVELTVPRGRKRAHGPGIVHRHAIFPGDVITVDAIPVTAPARTLIDLATVCSPAAVEEALDDALRRRIVTLENLRQRLAVIGRPGRPGVGTMRRLLDARDSSAGIPENSFERRLLGVLKDGGLPIPVVQYEVWSDGQFIARVDFAYPDVGLAIEADSFQWHSTRKGWDRDRTAGNLLMLLGWRVIRVTWTDLKRRPAWVAAAVRQALDDSP